MTCGGDNAGARQFGSMPVMPRADVASPAEGSLPSALAYPAHRLCILCGSATTGGGTIARSIKIRRQQTGAAITGASVIGALVVGPRLMGPSAMAPLAVAASAVGALAVGRLAIADAVIRKLRAEEIEIGSLKVRELEVAGQRWPGSLPPTTA